MLFESATTSSHVGKEIERATSKKRPIIVLRIDAAPLTPAFEYFLSESQWIEAQSGTNEAAHAKLIDAIREPERAAPTNIPAATPGMSAGKASGPQPKSRRNRVLLAAGLAVVALALVALLTDRFWLAKRVTAAQSTSVATNVVSDKSIAVLPFTDMSEKKDQEYFADGMAEEVIDLLAKLPPVIRVIGRTSSFQFKGKTEDLRVIGRTLGAAYVVGLAIAYHALGRKTESDRALARQTAEHASDSAYEIAQAHAYRAELDQAFVWLDRAYIQKDVELYWIKGDPLLKNLENDPRYKIFLRKMKLTE